MSATSPNAAPPPVERLPLSVLLEHRYRITRAFYTADGRLAQEATLYFGPEEMRTELAELDLLQRIALREPAVRAALRGT